MTDPLELFRGKGVEVFESFQFGEGVEPRVRFHGDRVEGFRALAVALEARLIVTALRRVWPVIDGEPTGPWWEMAFAPGPRAEPGSTP